jgi:hypothetical protein
VLDYLHDSLDEVPVDFRIIRNATGLGSFAQPQDVEALDVDRHTVFYRPPTVEVDASYQVSYVFEQPGDYIGIVTAGHPTKDKSYTAIFPFSVGLGGFPYRWVGAGVALILVAGLVFLWLRPGPPRTGQGRTTA